MKVDRKVAEQIVAAYMVKYKWPSEFAPQLLEDFDGRPWTIMWEEGPEDWVFVPLQDDHVFEFGFTLPGQPTPDGVLTEAINHYSLAVFSA